VLAGGEPNTFRSAARIALSALRCRLGDRNRFTCAIFERETAHHNPVSEPLAAATGESDGSFTVLIGPPQPVHLGHAQPMRVQAGSDSHQTRNRPGHNAIRTAERGHGEHFPVCDGGQYRRRHRTGPGRQTSQQIQPGTHLGLWPRSAQQRFVHQVSSGKGVQPGQRLQRSALPHPDQVGGATIEGRTHAQRPGEHRVSRTGGGFQPRSSAVEGRGRTGPADRGLSRGGRPVAQVGAVPMGLAQRHPGGLGRLGYPWEFEERRQQIASALRGFAGGHD